MSAPKPEFTRVDLEQNGRLGVIKKWWKAGWKEGDAPAGQEYIENGTVYEQLTRLEQAGYTVEMCDHQTGRALCGEITRIDFVRTGETWTVKKYPYGWTARTRSIETATKAPGGFDLESALDWCRKNGWSVSTWENGARAWKGDPLPVRDASAVRRMRRERPNNPRNFAFDY